MAEQLEFFPVQSPCRGICQSDERWFCRGCFRSRDERFNWNKMSDGEKQEVLRLCRQRLMRKLRANKPASSDEPEQPRPGVFPFCDGLLAIDGLEYVRPPAGQFY